MASSGDISWEGDTFYTEEQVEAVLKSINIEVENETEIVFLTFCPYHGNRDTPSFAVNKTEGLYLCYNPSCNKSGNLMRLVKNIGGLNDFQAKRLIIRAGQENKISIEDQLTRMLEPVEDFPEYKHPSDPNYFDTIQKDMWRFADPQLYMKGRGFEKITLKEFEIGYEVDSAMTVVPMHDPMGKARVGGIRRSIEGKRFKNTPHLPTSKTLFNLHRAKKTGDVVIICESSFDVMRLHQAGYPNACGMLMGHFSEAHRSLLNKYFNSVVIMTDWDNPKKNVYKNCLKCKKDGSALCKGHNPGEELGMKIAEKMSTKRIMWAHHGGVTRFPEGVKDVSDMDDPTIRNAVKNAVSHFEYILDS